VGLIGQQLSRAVPVQRARTGAASTAAMSATASGLTANRRERPSGAQLYRSWAVHGELVRAALDVKIGQLTMSAAVVSQLAMALVCLVFVILAVRSFIAARRTL